jgi:hypothetical protein
MRPSDAESLRKPRTVLAIGMLDSVHFARWLWQFTDEQINFSIFASKKYRNLNPLLVSLLESENKASFKLVSCRKAGRATGYFDYIKFEMLRRFGLSNIRKNHLSKLLTHNTFDYIHALEIQGAGYLLAQISELKLRESEIILTNWGSDIYFFKDMPEHLEMIKKSLTLANLYSAECRRDYVLARELGFSGRDLPCIPNAGGFHLSQSSGHLSKASDRFQIMIKGYGGRFGRAEIPIKLIPRIDSMFPQFVYFIYSATEEIVELVESFPPKIQNKIRLFKLNEKIDRDEFLEEYSKSRIYIGCSISDGISTSFLEALAHGTYPIQTNTSCAGEWLKKGFIGKLIDLNSDQVFEAIQQALWDNKLVDLAAAQNTKLSLEYLDFKKLQVEALTYYVRPASE